MKKAYLFIILLCLMSYGCEKNISLEIPKYNDKVVVYCILMPYNDIQVYLSLSQSYYSYADTNSTISNTLIQTAQVIVTDQTANKTDTLQYNIFAQSYGEGRNGFFAISGHHYVMNVNYQGKILTAETTVPMQAKIDHVDYIKLDTAQNQGTNYEFNVFFNTVAGGPNSYLLSNQTNFISDNGVAGEQLETTINYRLGPVYPDTVYFQLSNATQETANYLSNINIQSQNAGDPFTQPVIVEGNINGGLGIFGAITPGPSFRVIVK